MNKFYLYCKQFGNQILYIGRENNEKIIEKYSFSPSLFVRTSSNKITKYKSIYNEYLEEIKFSDINDAKEFISKYSDVEGFDIFGMTQFEYQFIHKNFPKEITFDLNQLKIFIIDIETIGDTENDGFPDIQQANQEIKLISVANRISEKIVVYGTRPYTGNDKSFEYKCFNSETELLKNFIRDWQDQKYPDIVTGWNTDIFDFPYLVNRVEKVLGFDWVKKLSPFGIVKEKEIEIKGKKVQTYDIFGVIQLDYLELYKKYGTYSAKESYGLGDICEEELNETKLENPGKSFFDFYTNYYNSFVEYNCHDSRLVMLLDQKKKLIELVLNIAYLAKCNIKDTFGPVKTWDVFIYHYLMDKNIIIPPNKSKETGSFEGAWVKEPQSGMHGWLMTLDFESLYPSIIRQWNLSPETLLEEMFTINLNYFI